MLNCEYNNEDNSPSEFISSDDKGDENEILYAD